MEDLELQYSFIILYAVVDYHIEVTLLQLHTHLHKIQFNKTKLVAHHFEITVPLFIYKILKNIITHNDYIDNMDICTVFWHL